MSTVAAVVEARLPKAVTPALFESAFVSAGEPRLFRGLVADWPARAWSFPGIGRHLPDRPLPASGPDEYGLTARGPAVRGSHISERLSASDSDAPGDADWIFDLIGDLPELLPQMPRPNIAHGGVRYRMFVGRNTVSHGHYHSYQHALLCQVHGRKRVVLYSPRDFRFLYPEPLTEDTHGGGSSRIDFRNPDLTRFPSAARAHPREVVLDPGDALFIPIHWWHAVYGLGSTVSVSLFWRARTRDFRFPEPGLRTLGGFFRWVILPKIRAAL